VTAPALLAEVLQEVCTAMLEKAVSQAHAKSSRGVGPARGATEALSQRRDYAKQPMPTA